MILQRRLRAQFVALVAAVSVGSVLMAIATTQAQVTPRIVNGLLTAEFPTTGALLKGSSSATASTWCSGTLIGCETFLTAAHCVEGNPTPSQYYVYLQHGGIFSVTSVELHPSYSFPVADVAVLKLGSAVTGIRPTAINTVQDPPFGSAGTIAGFGRSGGSNQDYGLKRYGNVTTSSCAAAGESNTTSVCWQFSSPVGAPGTDSNTCNADSGGPLFLDLGGSLVVAGVTSGGIVDSCLTGDVSYDADVYNYRAYIQSKAGADLGKDSCGAIAQVGDTDTIVRAFTGSVSSGTPQAVHAFVVASGSAELRVAMNATDDGSADFDLYLKHGSAPTTSSYDCARTGSNQYGVCTIASPASGTWYAMVRRYAGAGAYQLTATVLGASCANPANDGQTCDDLNPCTSDDACVAGACQGTASAEGGECGQATLCGGPGTCQAGVCKSNPVPATGCKQTVETGRAALTIKSSGSSSGNKIQWKWRGEESTTYGNPTSSTNYALCIFDDVGGVPRLIVDQSVPAGEGWKQSSSGFAYADPDAANHGVRSVKLRYGGDGRASVSVLSRGANVILPALPLAQESSVLVQLVADGGLCWEGRYASYRENSSVQFKALSD